MSKFGLGLSPSIVLIVVMLATKSPPASFLPLKLKVPEVKPTEPVCAPENFLPSQATLDLDKSTV